MKLTFLFFCCTLVSTLNIAQQQSKPCNPAISVKVTNWSQSALFLPDEYWANKKTEVINQIGEEEFKKVNNYCCQNVPSQMAIFDGHKLQDTAEVYGRLRKLNIYLIATYKNIHEGVDRGEYCILRIPYSENKNWDNTAKWDTVYFIIKKEFVTETN